MAKTTEVEVSALDEGVILSVSFKGFTVRDLRVALAENTTIVMTENTRIVVVSKSDEPAADDVTIEDGDDVLVSQQSYSGG